VPSYVLTDAASFQDNLRSFGKDSFEKKPASSSLILGDPVDDDLVDDGARGLSAPCPIPTGFKAHMYVLVKDFVTDLPVVGAKLYVDGFQYGVTDAEGWGYVGHRDEGSEHSLNIKFPGYFDANADELENDSFIVPPRNEV